MAKRKRKMTLFDVMHAGQPVGLHVKDRTGSTRPNAGGRDRPPVTAADELAALRRERERSSTAVLDDAPRGDDHRIPLEPAPEFSVVARPPREPRTPISEHVRRAWAVAAPKLAGATRSAGDGVRSVGRSTASLASAGWTQARRVRDVDTRWLWSGTVAAAALALLVGAFYVGRLLFRGPADTLLADANASDVRPDVLDVGTSRGTGETAGSIANRPVEAKLERGHVAPTPQPATPAVFGGRDVSLNYVVIETYNTPEEAAAAVDVLAANKIRATVEKNLPGWRSGSQDKYMVVGLDGFAKISTPDFKAYTAALDKLSEREAGKTLPARLQYGPYRWRG